MPRWSAAADGSAVSPTTRHRDITTADPAPAVLILASDREFACETARRGQVWAGTTTQPWLKYAWFMQPEQVH